MAAYMYMDQKFTNKFYHLDKTCPLHVYVCSIEWEHSKSQNKIETFFTQECDKNKKIQLVTLRKQPVFFYTKAFVYNCVANCLAIVKLSRHIIMTP